MPLSEYYDPDPNAPDRFYSDMAAVLDDFDFDRVSFEIAGSTYRGTDMTHWLALDTVSRALADAGFPEGRGLPKLRTGVVIGNTLTGEFSRSNVMRLRWPYVARTIREELSESEWESAAIDELLGRLESRYKRPFPQIDEDTLAGGLSNTIAGRICNYYDLNGGGYTVDGACSSSLLSVSQACQALVDGDLDVAIAGGVDLSLDPFEIIGFAKTGALAKTQMRLYDSASNGFWPGEGCGMVVLMREADAVAQGHDPYGFVAGWGISSDGNGGITRPEVAGYQLALDRAYERAGFGIESVPYFEGHGTGTEVGDRTELTAIHRALDTAQAKEPSVIGSVKAQFGHTKAAAGIAGLMRALHSVHHGVIPPTVGCFDPHPMFSESGFRLRPALVAEGWPATKPLRAGVTSMGFGGINTHVVVEADAAASDWDQDAALRSQALGKQDCELLHFAADSIEKLRDDLIAAADRVSPSAYYELQDLASLWAEQNTTGTLRACVVARSPAQAADRLRLLADAIPDQEIPRLAIVPEVGVYGRCDSEATVGVLFPGQGTGSSLSGGALANRFEEVGSWYRSFASAGPEISNRTDTRITQPWTLLGSLAGMEALRLIGVEPIIATGHSLGEIAALCWAGGLEPWDALHVAERRGDLMATLSRPGTMASVGSDLDTTVGLIDGLDLVVAAHNSPRHTVVAGTEAAVRELVARAEENGTVLTELPVSQAFHSDHVRPAVKPLAEVLSAVELTAPARAMVSTVTGELVHHSGDGIRDLLARQVVEPVRFVQALEKVRERCDLLVEVGPGRALTQLAAASGVSTVVALDTDDPSLESFLSVAGACWVAGASADLNLLHRGRVSRALNAEPTFLVNPTESDADYTAEYVGAVASSGEQSALELLTELVAERAELPRETLTPDKRLIEDLHLSSITVGQILSRAAAALGFPAVSAPVNLATATIEELAEALEATDGQAGGPRLDPLGDAIPQWIGTWTEAYRPLAAVGSVMPDRLGPEHDWRIIDLSKGEGEFLATVDVAGKHVRPGGLMLRLSETVDEPELEQVLAQLREALLGEAELAPDQYLIFVGGDDSTLALGKSIYLEYPHLNVLVLRTDTPLSAETLWAEVAECSGFREISYERGKRLAPQMEPAIDVATAPAPDGSPRVLVAVGGAKGITALSALALAADWGATLAIIGRSNPDDDPEVGDTIRRATEAGIPVLYERGDVLDPDSVATAIAAIREASGEITDLLYGAGINTPGRFADLTWEHTRNTIRVKRDGLLNVLEALQSADLKTVVTFGSIIGRFGLWGESHYAMANAALAAETIRFGKQHPACRTVCLEWSVWSGAGMGERLGAVESLQASGITPISPEGGVEVLRSFVHTDRKGAEVVAVTGRTDNLPTAQYIKQELPFTRYLEVPKRHYAGFGIVADSLLTHDQDPYLSEHTLDGNALLPAVMGIEAMSQVVAALEPEAESGPLTLTDVELAQAVIVPTEGLRIRVGAARRPGRRFEVCLLSEDTQFTLPHFSAVFSLGWTEVEPINDAPSTGAQVPLAPKADLYDSGFLFQGSRFQRVSEYLHLRSKAVMATITRNPESWFGPRHPATVLTDDPGARDAAMHANQVSVPDSTLLPERIDTIVIQDRGHDRPSQLTLVAQEVRHEGNLHVYDLDLVTPDGSAVECWRGLHLRAVNQSLPQHWHPALLGPHLERALEQLGYEIEAATSLQPEGLEVDVQGSSVVETAVITLEEDQTGGPIECRTAASGQCDRLGLELLTPEHSIVRGGLVFEASGDHIVYVLPVRLSGLEHCNLLIITLKGGS